MPKEPYRRNIQLCYPFSESRLLNSGRERSSWTFPAILQPKLNGERCRAVVSNGRCLLFSSTSELITTLPHINRRMILLPHGEYDGELYVHGWTFSEIHSAVSTVMSIHPRAPQVQLHIFDIISRAPQSDRIQELINLRNLDYFNETIRLVDTYAVHSLEEVMTLYDLFIEAGFEGFVLKDLNGLYVQKDPAYRSPYWMKFKPKQTDIYPILRFNEAISKDGLPKSMVGSFTCIDSEGTEFDVGAGKLTHKEREYLWAEGLLPGSRLLIEYQTLSDAKGVPHFSRACEIIYPNGGSHETA